MLPKLRSLVEVMEFEPVVDKRGKTVKIGDRVSFGLDPRGTARGIVIPHPRETVRFGGKEYKGLAIKTDDGEVFRMPGSKKLTLLKETKKKRSSFAILKANKVPLTDEERAEAKKKKAVWSNGDLAVWKGKDSKGNIVYVSHTHRVYNIAKSLGAIINKFHNFIKGTA